MNKSKKKTTSIMDRIKEYSNIYDGVVIHDPVSNTFKTENQFKYEEKIKEKKLTKKKNKIKKCQFWLFVVFMVLFRICIMICLEYIHIHITHHRHLHHR